MYLNWVYESHHGLTQEQKFDTNIMFDLGEKKKKKEKKEEGKE